MSSSSQGCGEVSTGSTADEGRTGVPEGNTGTGGGRPKGLLEEHWQMERLRWKRVVPHLG